MTRQGTVVILNPAARSATADEVRAMVGASAEIWTTEARLEGAALARRARDEGFATVIAAGGDGTLNEVVNGLMPDPCGVACGVLPLGTGNDFARVLGMPREPEQAWEALVGRRLRPVDLGTLRLDGMPPRWFVNMAVGGDIDRVHDNLTDELKQRWGPLAYLRAGAEAIASLLAELPPHRVAIEVDGEAMPEREVWSVVVANGRTVGGGIPVAPLALVGDGLLDCLVVGAVRGVELAKLSAAVLLGRHLDEPVDEEGPLFFRRAKRVEVRSSPAMPFTTDGEVVEGARAVFEVQPQALEMIVGEPE